jgi:hypothetical protein
MGAPRSLIWIDSAGAEVREMRTGNGSIYNLNHVNICRGLVRMVSERTDPSLNIALIGMYREQLRRYGGWKQWTNRDFRADTVDAFEGAEADIVIVDLVRSNPRGMVGFLEVHNRINVAMSRAKRLLIIVGDSQTVRSNRVLRQVLEGFRRSGAIIPWNRLPHVAKGQKRRRRRTRQPREGQARVVSITPTEENGGGGDSGADATPRRLPRLRDWTPGKALPDAAENGAGEADAVAGSDNRPGTGDMDQPRRSRRRRRRRRRRGPVPGDAATASDGGQAANLERPAMPAESSPAEPAVPPREPAGDPPAPAEG